MVTLTTFGLHDRHSRRRRGLDRPERTEPGRGSRPLGKTQHDGRRTFDDRHTRGENDRYDAGLHEYQAVREQPLQRRFPDRRVVLHLLSPPRDGQGRQGSRRPIHQDPQQHRPGSLRRRAADYHVVEDHLRPEHLVQRGRRSPAELLHRRRDSLHSRATATTSWSRPASRS